jgi:riboflavin synthase
MFTGLVEAIGQINNIEPQSGSLRFSISVTNRTDYSTKIGDSVAVNGCCLTVAQHHADQMIFDVSHETLDKTQLGQLQMGSLVNLERAMRLGDRLGGHMVLGHVDGTAKVETVNQREDGWDVEVGIPTNFARYIIAKGSICLNGVSLTVNKLVDQKNQCLITLTLIPTTLQETTFHALTPGQTLNFEVDMIGKYLERLHQFQ